MLNYNEIKERKYIVLNDEPYEVISSQVSRKQAQKPVNSTKLRNLITGSVRAETFASSDTAEEAEIDKKKITYLFSKPNRQENRIEYWFCEEDNRGNRFELSEDIVSDKSKWMKENSTVNALLFNDEVVGISLPIKVELEVTEAPPAVKGNTVSGANKQITLETGAIINAPMFISEGESVRVNTESGEYVERV